MAAAPSGTRLTVDTRLALARLEHRQQRIRAQIAQDVEDAGLLLRRGSPGDAAGERSDRHLDVIRLLQRPPLIWRLAADLVDLVPADLRAQIHIVAGRGEAGAILAHVVAGLIDGHRALIDAPCRFAMFAQGPPGTLSLDPVFASAMRGQAVLLVEACYDDPEIWQACLDLVHQAGGRVAAGTAIWARPDLLSGSSPRVIALCD